MSEPLCMVMIKALCCTVVDVTEWVVGRGSTPRCVHVKLSSAKARRLEPRTNLMELTLGDRLPGGVICGEEDR